MKPIEVAGSRPLYAPPGMESEVSTLMVQDGEENGHRYIVSTWMLSEEELQKVMRGGNIKLAVMSSMHPPVMLWVE